MDEVWGPSAREDRLNSYFVDKFELVGWINIEPIQLCPTWSNYKIGLCRVPKD